MKAFCASENFVAFIALRSPSQGMLPQKAPILNDPVFAGSEQPGYTFPRQMVSRAEDVASDQPFDPNSFAKEIGYIRVQNNRIRPRVFDASSPLASRSHRT